MPSNSSSRQGVVIHDRAFQRRYNTTVHMPLQSVGYHEATEIA